MSVSPASPTLDAGLGIDVQRIDCDVHLAPMSDVLIEYMPQDAVNRMGPDRRRMLYRQCFLPLGNGERLDAWGPEDQVPGTHRPTVERQLLIEAKIDFGFITPLVGVGVDPAHNKAVMRALNRWQADTWLAGEDLRLFGSICVSTDDVRSAVAEVEEWAGHPGFRQLLIQPDGERPYGHPQYDPLWEAAARHDLPVAMHFDESNRIPMGQTPTGRFASFVEYHSLSHPLEYAPHLASWICNGTFNRLPNFRVMFLEGGFLWHRPVIARLANQWQAQSGLLPDAVKHPLECLRDQVRFASQPLESPIVDRDLLDYFHAAEADKLLVFSSDYPHFDFDDPDRVLPANVDPELRHRIMCENAREFYGLPRVRRPDALDQMIRGTA